MSLDRRTLLKASALGVGGLAVTTTLPQGYVPVAHAGPPPTPSFGSAIEGYARYEGQKQCIGTEQPGVAAFKSLVLTNYPVTRNLGVVRACGIGGSSEHKEGRAWDWGVYVTRASEAAAAQEVITWLLATDRHGNRHANARRLGLMYMIWNRRVWKAYSNPGTWHAYTGSNPHTDHIHFSFGWPGAKKQTSFWTSAAPQQVDTLSWSPWKGTARRTWSAPAAVSWSSRRTDVFAVNAGQLVHRWLDSGSAWSPGTDWQNLGAPSGRRLASQPATASRGDGLLDVFATADDGQVWRRSYSPQTNWTAWASLGGMCTSAPAATSWSSDHLGVVVKGKRGELWLNQWDGRWSGWVKVPASPVTSSPALASTGTGRMDLFARGSRGDLVHNVYANSDWRGWVSLGGGLAPDTTPAAASMTPGNLDVFVIGSNDAVYRKDLRAGTWGSGFQKLGGSVVNGLGATAMHANHLEVFAQAPDGRLYQRWYS